MPIRPEMRSRYPKDWAAISARIRERAGNACEGNMLALCQRCHLRLDVDEHRTNAAATRARNRDAATGQLSLLNPQARR